MHPKTVSKMSMILPQISPWECKSVNLWAGVERSDWRNSTRGDVEDVGAVPRLQAGPTGQGGVSPGDHGAGLWVQSPRQSILLRQVQLWNTINRYLTDNSYNNGHWKAFLYTPTITIESNSDTLFFRHPRSFNSILNFYRTGKIELFVKISNNSFDNQGSFMSTRKCVSLHSRMISSSGVCQTLWWSPAVDRNMNRTSCSCWRYTITRRQGWMMICNVWHCLGDGGPVRGHAGGRPGYI